MKKLLVVIIVLVGCILAIIRFSTIDNGKIDLTFIVTGIIQGNIEPFSVNTDKPGEKSMIGGGAFLMSAISNIREKCQATGRHSLALSVGDDLPGTSQSFYTQGKSVAELVALLQLDAMSLGNREFDFGQPILAKRATENKLPLVSCNVFLEDNTRPDYLIPWKIQTIKGVKIGITGMAPATTPQEAKKENIEGLTFRDEKWIADSIFPAMRKEGADLIVIITQLDLIKELPQITELAQQADIIIALDYYHRFNETTKIENALVIPYFGLSKGSELYTAELSYDPTTKKIEAGKLQFSIVSQMFQKPDMAAARLIAEYARKIDKIKGRIIGKSEVLLHRPYGEVTNLGNLICDIMKEVTTAEIALQNSGSIRTDIPAGNITIGMIYDMLPFDNDIISMNLNGKQIEEIVRHAVSLKRGLLQVAGGNYSYQAISENDWQFDTMEIATSPLEPERIYRVATNDFIAGGGGGYKVFLQGTERVNHGRLRQIVSDWIEQKQKISGSDEKRILKHQPDVK